MGHAGLLLSLAAASIVHYGRCDWRPLDGGRSTRVLSGAGNHRCDLYKVVMQQDNYYQYVQYKAHLPDMKEFTICHWHKFYNHSTDHPIFSYGLKDQPREVVVWVANDERSSYYQLAIGGHTIYRVNYPVRLHKWYHACQSWNARTGEWQLWVNSERVSRGFYNLLVGKTIKGGGIAISGQTQSKYGGGFGLDSSGTGKESTGFYGEITLVQLYKAALTAGKAYNTHKHHHAHKFTHEDRQTLLDASQMMYPVPSPPSVPEDGTEYPFLRGMQLVPRLPVEELNVVRQQQELQKQDLQQQQMLQQQQQLPVLDLTRDFIPYSSQTIRLFKRENKNATIEKTQKKRTVFDFGVFPGIDLTGLYHGEGFPLGTGIIGPVEDPSSNSQEDSEENLPRKWSEPAEWEVMAIMNLCSGCGEDPFRKANVLSWRETSKKLYAGALYIQAIQECHHF
ncbi:uncharacterized protein b6 [Halyomorpha halys]|uniref:uncharacterized protein b6 n=1 Tax=Halyomorpha halys TaxID=286706 RepID=UPI0006D52135